MAITVRPARQEEYSAWLPLIDQVFFAGKPVFETEFPHLYLPPERTWSWANVAELDGALVGHIGIYPVQLGLSGGGSISAGGIGAVATADAARGKGVMGAMLEHVLRRMREQGFAISILGGDRWRYANYGWEAVGHRFTWDYDARHDQGPAIEATLYDEASDLATLCRRWQAVDQIPRLDRDGLRWHLRRPAWRAALSAKGCIVWKPAADGKSAQVDVLTGSAKERTGLLRWLHAQLPQAQITVTTGGPTDPNHQLGRELAANWMERPGCQQVAIIDLEQTLAAVAPVLPAPAAPTAVNLRISTGGWKQARSLAWRRGRWTTGAPLAGAATLRDHDVARLLFGSPFNPLPQVTPVGWHFPEITWV